MSTGIANLLEEENVEGYVGLTLAGMYEASLGTESVWSAYLALLANRIPAMASDLPEDARELMKKCEAYADIETDLVSGSMRCTNAVLWVRYSFSMWSLFVSLLLLFTFSFEGRMENLKFAIVFVYLFVVLLLRWRWDGAWKRWRV